MVNTILLVDDDPDIRTVLRLVLEDEGSTVREAPNGREALVCLADADYAPAPEAH